MNSIQHQSANLRVATYNIHKGLSIFNRRVVIHALRDQLRALDALAQVLQLAAAAARIKREVYAHAVQQLRPARHFNLGVQQSAAFEAV